jgi:ABC-2 type transport system ATP-binding protein
VPLVEVSNLEVRYGSTTAVDGVSLRVEAGEVVAVLGPNGAGKTSTIEAIEGYRTPAAGTIRVFGSDPRTDRHAVTPRWGVMPQTGGLPTGLRVREVVALHAALHDQPTDIDALVDLVGLASRAGQSWRRLSGGEQQRLSLAVALVGRPELLLLDEPTAALDPEGRRQVAELLRARATGGVGVLLTTHLLDDVEELCDRVVVIDRGRVVAEGSVADLTGSTTVVTFRAPTGLPLDELARAVGAPATEVAPGRYRVGATASPELLVTLTAWLAHQGVTASHLGGGDRLQDVFLRLTGGTDADGQPPPDEARP